jgi:hypothetical protein
MPTAIAGVIVGAIGVTGVAATVLTAVISFGITIGFNALLKEVFGPSKPKPSDGQLTARVAVGSRFRHYGIVRTGGQLSFYESRNGTLVKVTTLGTGEESEILEHILNSQVVSVDGGGTVTTASYQNAVSILTRPGADDQANIPLSGFSEWTADHRQRGCAHAAIVCRPVEQEEFSEVYNGREPEYEQTRKGVKLYDPRLDSTAGGAGSHRLGDPSTWAWSDNAALVIGDYLAHADGYGLGTASIDWANIAEEADIAEQQVTTVTAETIARWRIWARYGLARDKRQQVLADMLAACDGMTWQGADGKIRLRLGRWEEPTVTITDDHILAMTAVLGPKAQQRTDSLKVLYTEAAVGYREQESATVSVPGASSDPNTDPQAFEAYFAPHHNQAARLGKIAAARLGNRWRLDPLMNLFGLNLIGQRFCRVESEALGVSANFAVEQGPAFDTAGMKVSASLVQVEAADWDFDAATEEGTPPASNSTTGGTIAISPVQALWIARGRVPMGGLAAADSFRASWDAPERAGLNTQVQYRAVGEEDWNELLATQAEEIAFSGVVAGGTAYEVRARHVAIGGRHSEWSGIVTSEPPAAMTADTTIFTADSTLVEASAA